jgi:hypothetical protein
MRVSLHRDGKCMDVRVQRSSLYSIIWADTVVEEVGKGKLAKKKKSEGPGRAGAFWSWQGVGGGAV